MKKLHLLCNAHLDPVWLWRKNDGIAEKNALLTFDNKTKPIHMKPYEIQTVAFE